MHYAFSSEQFYLMDPLSFLDSLLMIYLFLVLHHLLKLLSSKKLPNIIM